MRHTWYYCSNVEDNIELLEEVANWSKEDTLVLQRSYHEIDHYSFCTKVSFHINYPVNYVNKTYLQLGKLCISSIIYLREEL